MKDLITKFLNSVGVNSIKVVFVHDKDKSVFPGWFLALSAILMIAVCFYDVFLYDTTPPEMIFDIAVIAFGFWILAFGPID